MYNKLKHILLFLLLVAAVSCKQSAPPSPTGPEEKGDIRFSGYEWWFKSSTTPVGPGPCFFSDSSANIWVDNQGYLHMKITNRDGRWYCAELVSVKEFGYGTYVFTTASNVVDIDQKVVVGLFTWDTYSFQKQANSEIDIEFSKWDNANNTNTLTYSAQPVSNWPTQFPERSHKPSMASLEPLKGVSTHVFEWTPSIVRWRSYAGENTNGTPIATYDFTSSNTPRKKIEGGQVSDPIVIPAPSDSTNARINTWLLFGHAPTDGKEFELILKTFKYTPM
jgi:hypothetical protein